MRAATKDWLAYAEQDLTAAKLLLQDSTLTAITSFHAQQVVEKLLKALLEEKEVTIPRTHDLERLYLLARSQWSIDFDEDTLRLVSSLYIDSRYPAEVGLLPEGRPSVSEAKRFVDFADELMSKIKGLLQFENERHSEAESGNEDGPETSIE